MAFDLDWPNNKRSPLERPHDIVCVHLAVSKWADEIVFVCVHACMRVCVRASCSMCMCGCCNSVERNGLDKTIQNCNKGLLLSVLPEGRVFHFNTHKSTQTHTHTHTHACTHLTHEQPHTLTLSRSVDDYQKRIRSHIRMRSLIKTIAVSLQSMVLWRDQ